MKSKYNVGVGVAAFVFHNGKFLIHKRTGAHGASTWAPPGGKLDFGETPKQGVAREVEEESGLIISDIQFIGITNDVFHEDGLHYVTIWFSAKSTSNNSIIVEPDKCLEQKWITLGEIPENLFIPTANILKDTLALEKLKEYVS